MDQSALHFWKKIVFFTFPILLVHLIILFMYLPYGIEKNYFIFSTLIRNFDHQNINN